MFSTVGKAVFKLKVRWAHKKADRKKVAEVRGWYNALDVKKKLTKAQKKEILEYYKDMTGRKVSLISHEYFYSRTGLYSKDYVPLELYHNDLLPRANRVNLSAAFGNKNIGDVFIPKEVQPRAVLKNINGFFFLDGDPVSEECAYEACKNIGDVVIKPSGKSKGQGVQRVIIHDGAAVQTNQSLRSLLSSYGSNYIVQEAVKQHADMSALNPTSVNTIRIVTYHSDDEVLHIYSVVRIGREGKVIDNQCAGGISTVIKEDGTLGKYAFGGYGENNVSKTDSGILLENYRIPSYREAVSLVKNLHLRLPYFRLIGWDVAIDEAGSPRIIEYNTLPGLSQSAYGPGFGEYTERIVRELWSKKSSLYAY